MLLLITLLSVSTVVTSKMSFKVKDTEFQYFNGSEWTDVKRFVGINLGATPPGKLPGEVALRYDDYTARFKRLKALGVNVIRVYALMHPDFYRSIIEWNRNDDHKIYLFHGTGFPEYELEENNGTDVYTSNITDKMLSFIENTVKGVYGQGYATYRFERGIDPIDEYYEHNVVDYLLGWVVAGEMTPHAINKTNLNNPNTTHYNGTYISAKINSTPFVCWMAEMLDHLANISSYYGFKSPISHVNWVTTDGIKNFQEPRYPDSVEDWMEIDQRQFDADNWEPGVFYNIHAYPYYPYLVSIPVDTDDAYKKYLKRIKEHYDDKPMIITEVGLSTSFGIASYENFKGRHHGGVGEHDQGELLEGLIKDIFDLDYTGVLIFQLQDEWFKKTWNTKNINTYNRHKWKNVLSAEQSFGLIGVDASKPVNYRTYSGNEYFDNIKISNDVAFIRVSFNALEDTGKIVIGIDNLFYGYSEVNNLDVYKVFDSEIDSLLIIDLDKKQVRYKQAGMHNTFLRNYAVWLNQEDNLKLTNDIDDIINPHRGLFFDYKMLVRVPGYYHVNSTNVTYNHESFTLTYKNRYDMTKNKNKGLFFNKDNYYEIDIPYQAMGIIDPSDHGVQVLSGQGKTYEIFQIKKNDDIKLEISYFLGETEVPDSVKKLKYNWREWRVNFCEKPKESFEYLRKTFHMFNNITLSEYNSTDLERCFEEISDDTERSFTYYVTTGCFFFLAFMFFYASVVKWIFSSFLYCYSFRHIVSGTSHRLRCINLLFFGGLFTIWYFDLMNPTHIEISVVSIIYMILLVWDSIVLLFCMIITRWSLYKRKELEEIDESTHAFVIVCHNSSDVIEGTLRSLLTKVKPSIVYVADNGSTEAEKTCTKSVCERVSIDYYESRGLDLGEFIRYGFLKTGNKSIAQYATLTNLPNNVKYVTCVDDDTRLDATWDLRKVLTYFKDDEVAVLAYPLRVHDPNYEIEYFQAIEYLTAGFVKIFHSQIRTTLFNSGAFGTYRVDIMKRALLEHNANFHGDDLQICLNIHKMVDRFIDPVTGKKRVKSYKVKTATDMIATTIVPKCWLHLNSLSRSLSSKQCTCGNPDLFKQRVKGWFLSEHRFYFRYLSAIFRAQIFTFKSMWIKLILFYDVLLLTNQYFAIFYAAFVIRYAGLWMLEGIMIGLAFNILVLMTFNFFFLRKNELELPIEVVTVQPIIYKLFIVTVYKYLSLLYNFLIYTPTHRNGKKIRERIKSYELKNQIDDMYQDHQQAMNFEFDNTDLLSLANSGRFGMATKDIVNLALRNRDSSIINFESLETASFV